jgi:hypothetical protein
VASDGNNGRADALGADGVLLPVEGCHSPSGELVGPASTRQLVCAARTNLTTSRADVVMRCSASDSQGSGTLANHHPAGIGAPDADIENS